MGFLKFLRKKGEVKPPEEDLDLPPAPPAMGDEELGLESLGEDLPRPPELSEFPDMDAEPEEKIEEEEAPERQEVSEYTEEPFKEVSAKIPFFKPERFIPLEKIGEESAKKDKEYLEDINEHKKIVKPVFIKVNRYQDVLGEIEMIKAHLNNFEKSSIGLGELKEEKDKRFTKWHENFKDIQKKLVFIDKTLFVK